MSIEANPIPKAELLAALQTGWGDFFVYLSQFSDQQMIQPTDAGGWTAKDHVVHLAMWENGLNALLQRISRHEYMGIPYEAWLRTDLRDWLLGILLDRRTLSRGYFERKSIEKLAEEDRRSGGYSKELFSLAVLELWHRTFLEG